MIISGQICGSNLQRVCTLGDGCWLPKGHSHIALYEAFLQPRGSIFWILGAQKSTSAAQGKHILDSGTLDDPRKLWPRPPLRKWPPHASSQCCRRPRRASDVSGVSMSRCRDWKKASFGKGVFQECPFSAPRVEHSYFKIRSCSARTDLTNKQSISRTCLIFIRKRGGVQKSMGKVPWGTGMLIYLPVTSRPPISPQKEATLPPRNHLAACSLKFYLP